MSWSRYVLAVGAALSVGVGAASAAETGKGSLYERLGGRDAITSVVEQFVANVGGDKRINQRFAGTDLTRLKKLLVEQVCSASGGPCTYTGRDMKTTHAGMQITSVDFEALVQDLVKSLDAHHVGEAEKKELLGILAPMKTDIVERP